MSIYVDTHNLPRIDQVEAISYQCSNDEEMEIMHEYLSEEDSVIGLITCQDGFIAIYRIPEATNANP